MQSLGDLGANEPGGALHRRVIDRSCRPTFDLLVALTTGAGSENVAKRRTQQNPEHSDPHSLDLRQFTGDTSGQTTKAQVDDLGLCSPDWTRTSNRPINSRMLCQLSYGGPAPAAGDECWTRIAHRKHCIEPCLVARSLASVGLLGSAFLGRWQAPRARSPEHRAPEQTGAVKCRVRCWTPVRFPLGR